MLERLLLEAAIQLVRNHVLLAALAAFIRGKQLKQVGRAAGKHDSMRRYFPLSNLSRVKQLMDTN